MRPKPPSSPTANSSLCRLASVALSLVLASSTLLAQAPKTITNSEVRDEHSAIGVAGSKAPASFHRNTHPEAQWYPSAGLGLFIHWGISTVEAKSGISWQMVAGRELSKTRLTPEEIQKVIATNGWKSVTTPRHYWSLAPQFKPDKYDPDKWLRAAKAAGFKYVVLTARHHDGFALWPSAYGNFNTKNFMGGKDLLKPYVEAARRNGLKVGFYYSPPDWYFTQKYNSFLYHGARKLNPELPDLDIDLKPANLPKPTPEETQAYRDYLRGQIKELLTNYGKIDILWFDGKPDVISIDEIRAMQPGIVVNDRMWGYGDSFTRSERNLAPVRPAKDWWENCQVWAKSSWAYVDEDYKPNSAIIEQFVRVRAWNGNFLLNVGPMSNGELPPVAYDRMTEFGSWIHQNDEAIFGTTDAPDSERSNVPVTARAGLRYLHAVPSFQGTTLELTGTKRPKSVSLLRDGKALKFQWSEQEGLKVELPTAMRSSLVDVVKVELPSSAVAPATPVSDASPAPPFPGLKPYSDTYKVQKPHDLADSDRFSVSEGPVYNAWIVKGDKGFTPTTKTGARTEMRWNTNWTKGEHFWEADVMVDPGTEGTAIMQVHATDCACEPIYVQVISNGDLRNDGNNTVIAHDMWGKWFHMVASYDPDSGDGRVWINGELVVTRHDPRPDRVWYFKNGVYGIKGDKSGAHFKNIRFWSR